MFLCLILDILIVVLNHTISENSLLKHT